MLAACIGLLDEDSWKRLRTLLWLVPGARLQILPFGQKLLGYRHCEDGVVDHFVERPAASGVEVFRIFDAVNDLRNVRRAIEAVGRAGRHAQGPLCYTTSPLHDTAHFVALAADVAAMGCQSLCIKEMAALLRPQAAWDLVRGIKRRCGEGVPVHLHVHATTGVTLVSLMKAIEAGADAVDTCISSHSLGPGRSPTEALAELLAGLPSRPGSTGRGSPR